MDLMCLVVLHFKMETNTEDSAMNDFLCVFILRILPSSVLIKDCRKPTRLPFQIQVSMCTKHEYAGNVITFNGHTWNDLSRSVPGAVANTGVYHTMMRNIL